MIPKLTDDAVSDLPLLHGRADLLEEIMSTPVLDDRPVRDAVPRRPWLVPAVAAAMVAVLALGAAWWTGGLGGEGGSGVEVTGAPGGGGRLVVLDAPGWQVDLAQESKYGGEIMYSNGGLELGISWYPADQYESYVEDRRHITEPPTDGAPVEVLGLPAQLWAYSANDHAALREVEGAWTLEFRGRGMDEAAFLDLLDQLRAVDRAGFEAAMPPSFVDTTERDAEIESMLSGISAFTYPVFPPQGTRIGVSSNAVDPLWVRIDVASAVACSWLADYVEARHAGDDARAQLATEALVASRQWPLLKEIDADTSFPEAVWTYVDQVEHGKLPRGYSEGLSCEG